MVQLSATSCSYIAMLWVSLLSFAAITLYVASQRVFIVVYFVFVSIRKLLYIPSYIVVVYGFLHASGNHSTWCNASGRVLCALPFYVDYLLVNNVSAVLIEGRACYSHYVVCLVTASVLLGGYQVWTFVSSWVLLLKALLNSSSNCNWKTLHSTSHMTSEYNLVTCMWQITTGCSMWLLSSLQFAGFSIVACLSGFLL